MKRKKVIGALLVLIAIISLGTTQAMIASSNSADVTEDQAHLVLEKPTNKKQTLENMIKSVQDVDGNSVSSSEVQLPTKVRVYSRSKKGDLSFEDYPVDYVLNPDDRTISLSTLKTHIGNRSIASIELTYTYEYNYTKDEDGFPLEPGIVGPLGRIGKIEKSIRLIFAR